MRIYAVADLHGRRQHIQTIRNWRQALMPDVLIVAGDLAGRKHWFDCLSELDDLELPVWLIRGNADPSRIDEAIAASRNVTRMTLAPIEHGGHQFCGIDGAIPLPLATRICWQEKRLWQRARKHVVSGSVIVVHPPPYGVQDKVMGRWHAGSKGVAELIRHTRPALVICGHIHEQAGVAEYGHTMVVNCAVGRFCGALIELKPDMPPGVRMIPANSTRAAN